MYVIVPIVVYVFATFFLMGGPVQVLIVNVQSQMGKLGFSSVLCLLFSLGGVDE